MDQSIVDSIYELALAKLPCETGGMLMGYVGENEDIVVTKLIGPGPKAAHKRTSFKPDHEFQMIQLTAHFQETNGIETYLGDWHTHPEGSPSLSFLDKKTLSGIALSLTDSIKHPIMVVASLRQKQFSLGAYRFERHWQFLFMKSAIISPMRIAVEEDDNLR